MEGNGDKMGIKIMKRQTQTQLRDLRLRFILVPLHGVMLFQLMWRGVGVKPFTLNFFSMCLFLFNAILLIVHFVQNRQIKRREKMINDLIENL